MRTETLTSLVDTASTDDLLKLEARWLRRAKRWDLTGLKSIGLLPVIFAKTYEARMYRLNGHIDTAWLYEDKVDRLICIVCTEKGA